MSNSPLEEIRRLKAELATAMRTIDRVGQGLDGLEQQLARPHAAGQPTPVAAPPLHPGPAAPPLGHPQPRPLPYPPPSTPPLQLPLPAPTRGPHPVAPIHPAFRPQPTAPPRPPSALAAWWQRESTIVRVLGIAGALVTLVGLTLLLVLAVQQNWFTPTLRVGLGTALSVGLIAAAWLLRHRLHRAGRATTSAVALAATGHAGLYLVVLAITQLYRWVPLWAGLLLAGIVAVIGIITAVRWQSQLMAALQVVCIGLLALPLTGEPSSAGAFVVLVTIGLAPVHVHTWKRLGITSFSIATLAQLVAGFDARPGQELWLVTVVSAMLWAAGPGVAIAEARRGRASGAGMFIVIASGLPWLMVATIHESWTAAALLGMAAVVGLLAFVLAPRDRTSGDGFGWAVLSTPVLALALLVLVLPWPSAYWVAGLLGVAALVCLLAGWLRAEPLAGWAALLTTVALLVMLPLAMASFSRPAVLGRSWLPLLLAGLLAAALAGLALWATTRLPRTQSALRPLLVIAVLVGLLGLMMAAVATGAAMGHRIDNPDAGFTSGHAIGTIIWMLAAAVLLVRGLTRAEHADLGVKLALGLAGVAVAKLFLYDLAALSGIWRGAAFVVVGLLLLGLGVSYARALERAARRRAPGDDAAPRGRV
ncbi:DUF2339 domain-containing protein [Aestuariimicrobium sp. Y1814]|uniref:DUF2339 domain-containing protein n=1 Tax=Aestuariimicrobium sp. Y1814 TaxID=3418742 RepID=UPI003DA72AFA